MISNRNSKGDQLSSCAECRIQTPCRPWCYPIISIDMSNYPKGHSAELSGQREYWWHLYQQRFQLGLVSIWRPSFPGMEIPMLKIRRSRDRLIFNMGIPIQVRHIYIEMTSRFLHSFFAQILHSRQHTISHKARTVKQSSLAPHSDIHLLLWWTLLTHWSTNKMADIYNIFKCIFLNKILPNSASR